MGDVTASTPPSGAAAAGAPPARRLDRKLAAIAAGRYTPDDFVIADAKDADMAFGVTAAGVRPDGPSATGSGVAADGPRRYRTRSEYLAAMRSLVQHDLIDVLLTSASNGERLSANGSVGGEVTLAVRANDSTDVWNVRGSGYPGIPSRPFRTAHLPSVRRFCDLVLYSVTFNNDLDHDLRTVEAYAAFRDEAASLGLRHFLEVFNPNAPVDLAPEQVGEFVNDSIIRTLAGVTSAHRPVFLKMPFNGAGALGELVEHDASLVVGVLGGSAGTTRDTFELLAQAERHGARVALFGRKIQRAESQLDLVGLMRPVLRGELSAEDATREYHEALAKAGVAAHRSLDADLEITDPVLQAG